MSRSMLLYPMLVECIPENLTQNTLYISLKYYTVIHMCCCGCGNKTVTPVNTQGWKLTLVVHGVYIGVSLWPSIGNFQIPCKSHYYIKDNKVEWL